MSLINKEIGFSNSQEMVTTIKDLLSVEFQYQLDNGFINYEVDFLEFEWNILTTDNKPKVNIHYIRNNVDTEFQSYQTATYTFFFDILTNGLNAVKIAFDVANKIDRILRSQNYLIIKNQNGNYLNTRSASGQITPRTPITYKSNSAIDEENSFFLTLEFYYTIDDDFRIDETFEKINKVDTTIHREAKKDGVAIDYETKIII